MVAKKKNTVTIKTEKKVFFGMAIALVAVLIVVLIAFAGVTIFEKINSIFSEEPIEDTSTSEETSLSNASFDAQQTSQTGSIDTQPESETNIQTETPSGGLETTTETPEPETETSDTTTPTTESTTPTTEISCNNGIDDDVDGSIDYADRDCIGSTDGCPTVGGVQTQVVWSHVPEENPDSVPSRRGCCATTQCIRANGVCVNYDSLVGSDFICGNENDFDRCGPEGDPRYNKHFRERSEGENYICDSAAWVDELLEVNCQDGIDNDSDGVTDIEDIDCLGQFCEPAPSKKVWVWTYDLTHYAVSPYWRIQAPGFSFNGLTLAEATMPRAAGCCKKEQCYIPGTGCVDSNVEMVSGSPLCWEMGSEEPSNSIGGGSSALYKNSFLHCTADSVGARVIDETHSWSCLGGGGWRSFPR